MKKSLLIILLSSLISYTIYGQAIQNAVKPEQTIFVYGSDINPKFIQYVIELTNKPNPKIYYLPTASADNTNNSRIWESICKSFSIESHILKVWVSSSETTSTFEETLLHTNVDAIFVGGGNTLNMLGIWKAQGIDLVLKKALEKGIILAGGSAGSICWFQNGISDSRPVKLSVVDGLSFLPYSNCPHYGQMEKKQMYHQAIKNNELTAGYAFDDAAGALFKNGKFVEAVSTNDINSSYYVSLKNGEIDIEKLKYKILINKDAINNNAYKTIVVDKKIKDFEEISKQNSPLDAFVSIQYLLINGKNSKLKSVSSYHLQNRLSDTIPDKVIEEIHKNTALNKDILKIFVYNDSVASVISKGRADFYGLWYFYKENGKWMNAGEDIGGSTVDEAEITFREKASKHLDRVRSIPINN